MAQARTLRACLGDFGDGIHWPGLLAAQDNLEVKNELNIILRSFRRKLCSFAPFHFD